MAVRRFRSPAAAAAILALLATIAPVSAQPGRSGPIMPRRVFAQPRVSATLPAGRDAPLAVGTVLAEETVVVEDAWAETVQPISIGAPFRVTMPAGTPARMRLIDERAAPCVSAENEPRDERGNRFVEICLVDRDRDGRHEIARFLPAHAKAAARDVPIAPAAVRPRPARLEESPPITAGQRVRIATVKRGRAVFVHETRVLSGYRDEPWEEGGANNPPRITLPLRDGASAQIAGLTLRARQAPDGWRLAVEGDLKAWISLTEQNTVIRHGSSSLAAY